MFFLLLIYHSCEGKKINWPATKSCFFSRFFVGGAAPSIHIYVHIYVRQEGQSRGVTPALLSMDIAVIVHTVSC